MIASTPTTTASVRRGDQEDLQYRASTLGAMLRRLTGALRKADLDRTVRVTTDPTATRNDPHKLPMSAPRTARCDVTLHLAAAHEHAKQALAALGIDWQDN